MDNGLPSYEELQRRLADAEAALVKLRRERSAEASLREEAIVESERRYRALFENMSAGFVLFEVSRDEHGEPEDLRIVAANHGFAATTGLRHEESIGRLLTKALPGIEQDDADWVGKFTRVATTGEPLEFEHGSDLLGYEYAVSAYQPRADQCAVTFVDITERVKAEHERVELQRQLLQAQKLEAVGQLAGGVAHDFNNILVPIIGYVELALMRLDPEDKLHADLQEVLAAAHRAADLTRQILAFGRKQVLEVRPLSLNAIIEGFTPMINRLIREDIELRVFLEPELCHIRADQAQIEQVLLNLVVNARDSMPDGGGLVVETANVYLDDAYVKKYAESQPTGHYAMLAVTDAGVGMNAETQERIFEPFFTTKGKGQGTGLGLATVFGIVKQHGGAIWVYSEPGRGATFKVYLPRVEDDVQQEEPIPPEALSAHGDETILVVEDETMVRQLVCEALTAFGYHVIEAPDAEEGLRLAREASPPPQLLLTDVIMPGMNGRQLFEQLAPELPGLRVLYMSGYTDNVIVHHGILDAGVDLLQKPFSVRSLTQKVREVLAK